MRQPIIINEVEVSLVSRNGSIFATSLDVANVFEKQHKDVLSKIRSFNERAGRNFSLKSYVSNGKELPMYEMNRDGFSFLVMGFTGEKADNFKLDFIDGFNAMEAELRKPKDDITLLLESALENRKQLLKQDERLTILENSSTIDHAQQRMLQNTISAKVYECIDQYNLPKESKKELFSNMYSKLKNTFLVASYRDVTKVRFNEALELIETAVIMVGVK